jgi:hypothetical protein
MGLMKIKQDRIFVIALFLALLVGVGGLACRAVTGLPSQLLQEQTATFTALPPTSTLSATPSLTATATTAPTLDSTPDTGQGGGDTTAFQVRFHPDDALYVGDRVSIEVIAASELELIDVRVSVELVGGIPIGEASFDRFGIAGRSQATLIWAWDTHDFDPGEYLIRFSLQPGGESWIERVVLQPAQAIPIQLAGATWAQAQNDCCEVHYITGTEAERDLDLLLAEIDRQAQNIETKVGVEFDEPISLILLPRLLGHGGFASGEIHVSYLDRNYTGGNWEYVVHHEMAHIMDARLGGDFRPSLLVEGLAVYLTGGHYKPEQLMPRAAALLDSWGEPPQPGLNWYIPLEILADHFYTSQHEIGYLQAAALVEYLVNTYGWEAFNVFYRDIQPDSESQAAAMDAALRKHFGQSLVELEQDFRAALRKIPADPVLGIDVRQTVEFFDMVRRYQQLLDPSAYFLTAWLVDTERMREEGIVADYLRHPDGLINLTFETMLVAAGGYVAQGQSESAEAYLSAIREALDALASGAVEPFSTSSIASDHYKLVQLVTGNPDWVNAEQGRRVVPQRILIDGQSATVWLTAGDIQLVEARLERDWLGNWQFLSYGAQ